MDEYEGWWTKCPYKYWVNVNIMTGEILDIREVPDFYEMGSQDGNGYGDGSCIDNLQEHRVVFEYLPPGNGAGYSVRGYRYE